MNFLRNLFGGGQRGAGDRFIPVYVLSYRCNEPVASRLDTMSELSIDDGEHAFYVRKVLHTSGERRCFGEVEIQVWLDRNKKIVAHEVSGGRWLDADEYKAELARFNAPPEEEDEEDNTEETKTED